MKSVLCILAVIGAMFVISGSALASPKPGCPIDENGNCIGGDSDYADADAGVVQNDSYDFYAGCTRKAVWASRNYRSIFGPMRFRYFEQINWCFSQGRIVTFSRARWVQTWWPWVFDGNADSNCANEDCSEKNGQMLTETNALTQGHFHACVAQWAVCSNRYPIVVIGVNGYGGWGVYTAG